MKNKKALLALLSSLITAPALAEEVVPKPAAKGSVEVLAGDKSATLDSKLKVNLGSRFSLFFRSRTTVDYHNKSSYFGLLDVNVDCGYGIDVFVEGRVISGKEVVPRVGISYTGQLEDFGAALLLTAATTDKPDLEIHPIWSYRPRLNDKLRLVVRGEDITIFNKIGHNSSVQRLRTGIEVEGYQLGPGVDFKEVGQGRNLKFDYNVGGFVSKSF